MDNEDPLAPARGILIGLVFGYAIWAIAITLGVATWKALSK